MSGGNKGAEGGSVNDVNADDDGEAVTAVVVVGLIAP